MCFMDPIKIFMVLGLHYLFCVTAGYNCIGLFPTIPSSFQNASLSYGNQFSSHPQVLLFMIVTWLVFLTVVLFPG